jgi:pimeloyl-ACP methyl ester carboxylesterase
MPSANVYWTSRDKGAILMNRKRIQKTQLPLGLGLGASIAILSMVWGSWVTQAAEQAPLVIAKQGWMYVGGRVMKVGDKSYMTDQMYVEYQIPAKQTRAYPIIMVHSIASGILYTGTPDGREGWAQYFLRQGYPVYVVDRVGRGRSRYLPESQGPLTQRELDFITTKFSSPASTAKSDELWPQVSLQTQWPGSGTMDDPAVQQLTAAILSEIPLEKANELTHRGLVALLEKIGPSVLLVYSATTANGWTVTDEKPDLIKAVLAIGPTGPPAHRLTFIGAPDYFKYGELMRPFGLTSTPLTYSPPIANASDLAFVQQDKADGPGLVRCYVQAEPARKLSNLRRAPFLVVTPEASDHAPYDHCTAKYLKQAGVDVTFLRLSDIGIHGNGDAVMLEKNNLQIAGVVAQWLEKALARYASTAKR